MFKNIHSCFTLLLINLTKVGLPYFGQIFLTKSFFNLIKDQMLVPKVSKRRATTILLLFCFGLSTLSLPLVSATEDSWTTMEPMPTARSNHSVAVVGEKIYAIGGGDSSWLNCTEEYNTSTDTWTIKAAMPTKRSGLSAAVYQEKIYVIGGWGPSPTIGITGKNEVYDPASNTWETKTPMPTARTDVLANQVNGKIYVMAGKNFTEHAWPVLCNQTEIYDPLTDSWTTGAAMPDFQGIGPEIASKSENVASAVLDNKVYVIVGKTLHIYDTEADVWSYGADLPSSLTAPAACATTGSFAPKRLHAVGLGSHYVYDPDTDEWTSATPVPDSRYWVELGVVDDMLYAIGGGNDDGEYGYESVNYNEQYIPVGYIPEFPAWTPILFVLSIVTVVLVVYRRKLHKISGN